MDIAHRGQILRRSTKSQILNSRPPKIVRERHHPPMGVTFNAVELPARQPRARAQRVPAKARCILRLLPKNILRPVDRDRRQRPERSQPRR